MKVTIREIINKCDVGLTMRQVKSFLTQQKQQGGIFFQESVDTLSIDYYFDLYFYIYSSKLSSINAFPIPLKVFTNNNKISINEMKIYFESYYPKKIAKISLLKFYELNNPHVGESHVWFYIPKDLLLQIDINSYLYPY
ncbi:hypothetical protein [Neobacillus vireti]|uniref:hypothetical protein n=1 Tax=Neobacillus vireti TaxID=220686 RepID=UPI00300079E9